MKMLAGLWWTLLSAAAPPQAPPDPAKPVPAHPKVDQEKVDEAIRKGCAFLLTSGGAFGTFPHGKRNQPEALQSYAELVLLTLAHSGYYADGDPAIQPLVEYVLQKPIGSTYTASLMAMALQKLDARKYQARIARCAQFLVDNQCQNGQWDYGEPLPPDSVDPADTATTGGGRKPPEDVATGGGGSGSGSRPPGATSSKPGKTEPLRKIPIRKRRPGPPAGDNSNSQYAALGLRACLEAGCDIEARVLQSARRWWVGSQNSDGGWGYNGDGSQGGEDNETGVSNTSYGSMTVGAVGALCIFDHYLGINYKTDSSVQRGLEWIVKNYDVTANPRKKNFAYLYYLYGLERVGMLYGTEQFGPHEWYPDGANHLLKTQNPFGFWDPGDRLPSQANVNTCFAVLFLRRGTAPLRREAVATGGPAAPRGGGAPVANPGRPGAAEPHAGAGGLSGQARAVQQFAPGWKLVNSARTAMTEKLIEVRGRGGVLMTAPPDLQTSPTLRRTLEVAPGVRTTLRAVVGYPDGGGWTLAVRVSGKDVLTRPVGPQTAPNGWLEVAVDLTPHAGTSVLVELVNHPGGIGIDLAYWAEVSIREEPAGK